jgi:hypothetical protein
VLSTQRRTLCTACSETKAFLGHCVLILPSKCFSCALSQMIIYSASSDVFAERVMLERIALHPEKLSTSLHLQVVQTQCCEKIGMNTPKCNRP